jgi:nicotinamide mononucleotide adenylyltransferase
MNELSKYLVEQILLEEPTPIKKTVVVYVGRFQPFHKGHYGTYSHLVKKFGKDNVYIGTSNKVERPKSPFNFKEKKEIMTTMFGVPSNKIFEVKNPYAPLEILKKFDEKTTAFITVVGEKDASRLGGKYFQKWNGEATEGYKDRGYVYASPMQGDSVSGTEVRIGLGSGTEEQKKNFFVDRAYTKFNKNIFNLITNKLQESSLRLTKTQIEDLLIEVSSGFGQDMVDDGPVIFLPHYESFKVINAERAQQIGWEIINMVMDDSMDDYIFYPEGPVHKVTFFPRGAIGKKDSIDHFDVMVKGAYDKWYKHATRTASLVGYSVVDKAIELDDKLSTQIAKGNKALEKESDKTIQRESITLPVEIGDTLLMGKFKNKKVVVKTIGKDEHGMPTINGKKVVTFRLVKEGKQVIFEDETEDAKYTHIGYGKYKQVGKEEDETAPTFQKDESGKYVQVGDTSQQPQQSTPANSLNSKTPAGKSYQQQLPSGDPAKKQEPKQQPKQEPKSNVTTFAGKKSGKEIQTTNLAGGGSVFGTQHGDNKMVDDILDTVKSTIPQDRWKDVVFVGEGGYGNENGEFEFSGEMDYAAKKFQKIGAGVDTWDGDDTNVFDNESPLYKYQEEQTGLSNEEVMAANWASMIGQGDSLEDMSPEDYLTDSGKAFLQQSAQEANLSLSNNGIQTQLKVI